MIVPMKTVSLIVLSERKADTLKKLRRLGLMQIEITEGSGERIRELHEQLACLLYTSINAWNAGERDLRLALGKARAERMKKIFDAGDADLPAGLLQTARTAAEMEDPMEAEKFLSRYRQDFLESLRPMDMFAEDAVFYYALKLKLLVRASRFDAAAGKAAYRNIYNSIINGDRLEVVS